MTRHELNRELVKLDRYIEVQQLFVENSLCGCISKIEDKFKDTNIALLKQFNDKRHTLRALENENVLKEIVFESIALKI